MIQPARLNAAATYTQTQQRMGPRHEGFVEIANRGDIDLLLDGDSITDWWVQGEDNKAVFEKYFGGMKTANFAIAGDTTQGVLWGLKNGEGRGFQPKENPPSGHFGLLDMRERAHSMGCALEVESAPDCGTKVSVEIPLKAEEGALL